MPLPAHGTIVLVSDWLDPLDKIEAVIRHYASGGVRGHLVQVLDPAEEDLPFDGHVKFEGLEAEGQHTIRRVEAVRTAYGARLAAQKEGLQRLTRSTDWTVHLHRTDKPPQTVLLSLYLAMADLASAERGVMAMMSHAPSPATSALSRAAARQAPSRTGTPSSDLHQPARRLEPSASALRARLPMRGRPRRSPRASC